MKKMGLKVFYFSVLLLLIATISIFYFDKQNKSILDEEVPLLSGNGELRHFFDPVNAYSTMYYDPERDKHNDYPGPYKTGYWPNDYRHINKPGSRDHTYMVPADDDGTEGDDGGSANDGNNKHNSAPGTAY